MYRKRRGLHTVQRRRRALFDTEESELDAVRATLTHAQSWIQLHANQRQNLLNFFLIAVAFLFNAYVGALVAHRIGSRALGCGHHY